MCQESSIWLLLEVSCIENYISGVYSVINARKGKIIDQICLEGCSVRLVKAYIPVAKSFEINKDLRQATSGQAFPSLMFDHWDIVVGDPLSKTDNPAKKVISEIRLRKGMKPEIPSLDEFYDRF